jgi:hypothetical protein
VIQRGGSICGVSDGFLDPMFILSSRGVQQALSDYPREHDGLRCTVFREPVYSEPSQANVGRRGPEGLQGGPWRTYTHAGTR